MLRNKCGFFFFYDRVYKNAHGDHFPFIGSGIIRSKRGGKENLHFSKEHRVMSSTKYTSSKEKRKPTKSKKGFVRNERLK